MRRALSAASVVLDAVLAAQLLTARNPEVMAWIRAPGIGWIGPVWFSAHVMLFCAYVAGDVARALSRGVRRIAGGLMLARRRGPVAGADPAYGPDRAVPASDDGELLGRREVLQRAGLLGAALPFAVSLSNVPLAYDFRVEEHEVMLRGWPRALDGLRVVHLSDIHVGSGMTRERLARVAELTNGCRPDLVLHTGDFLTHRSGAFDLPLYEALARIRATFGQWACLGNHDFDDPARLVRRLGDAGVAVLRDRLQRVSVDGTPIEIAGADFVFGGAARRETYDRLVRSFGPHAEAPRLFLNHDPTAFAALPEGAADLVLSGHTHGGQVGIQLGATRAITVLGLLGIPDQGLFARGEMQLFVTRCVGFYGFPMRLGIPPEIALLVLRPAPGGARTG